MLMIVDPQVDFINGALPVEGAVDAMDALARYVAGHGSDYELIVVTADRHPFDHCSFGEQGGPWPRHCVHDSVGAAVWPSLMEALYAFGDRAVFLYKGERRDVEEYSIFANAAARDVLVDMAARAGIRRVDICGIAGDVCVADSIIDGRAIRDFPEFNILDRFTASLDGGRRLASLVRPLGDG